MAATETTDGAELQADDRHPIEDAPFFRRYKDEEVSVEDDPDYAVVRFRNIISGTTRRRIAKQDEWEMGPITVRNGDPAAHFRRNK